MTQTQRSIPRPRQRHGHPYHAAPPVTRWIGWVVFAALVMVTTGVLSVIQGLIALLDEDYYASGSALAIPVSYPAWGWTLLIFGALLTITGWGLLGGRTWARIAAVLITSLHALTNFAFMAAYPVWSIIAITLDVVVIYAIVVHGREAWVLRP